MVILYYISAVIAGAAAALGVYIPVRRHMLNGQKEDVIQKAEMAAENIRKETISSAIARAHMAPTFSRI